ncbi:hypothetical protein [Paenibacillus aestuarii]|uniref:Uncharacterized protein n=1 Tax=Paenibacillus aestuarii TaxID=516965 RepID=A0ABW0KA08_9BACL|nr:hypothetical protein [Paenibacillus aestuarii]
MTKYWLTPIVNRSPLLVGRERIVCEPLAELEKLREIANGLHPRLLPMFKASMLLSDDPDVCGAEADELELASEDDIVFDGTVLHLSHCAEAFLDRLLTIRETQGLVYQLAANSERLQSWKQLWLSWLDAGWAVILLREDGM